VAFPSQGRTIMENRGMHVIRTRGRMKPNDIWMAGCRAYEVSSKRAFLKLAELTYISQHHATIPEKLPEDIRKKKGKFNLPLLRGALDILPQSYLTVGPQL
jgi:hypothetical protein